MDVFDEDAEPFDLKDDADVEEEDDDYEDDLEEATEDDVDLVVALYREDGKATAVPLDFDLANDLDELIRQLGRLPGDSGADGWVSIGGEFFVLCRVRGRTVEVLLSDATAANDWPIARDVADFLGSELPEDDEDADCRHDDERHHQGDGCTTDDELNRVLALLTNQLFAEVVMDTDHELPHQSCQKHI